MRRALIIIGLLLLPVHVSAAALSPGVQAVSGAALSPWVQAVLERAQAGIDFAEDLPVNGCGDLGVLQEIENNLTVIRGNRTTIANMTSDNELLGARTLCTESDRRLITEKMDEVYQAMNAAVTNCNLAGSDLLRENYGFLVASYESFLRGAVDASFADNRLRYNYRFHDSALFGSGADRIFDSGSTLPLCPFTTDYSSHAIGYVPTTLGGGISTVGSASFDVKSYGCDATVLSTLPPSFQTEVDDFQDFLTQTDSLASNLYTLISQTLFNIDSTIALITNGTPPIAPPAVATPPPHEKVSGCLRPPSPEQGGPGDPAALDALLAAYPDYFDFKNLRYENISGTDVPTYNPPPGEMLPEGVMFRPVSDPFSVMNNPFTLLRLFSDRKSLIGFGRPLPHSLLNAGYGDMFTGLGFTADKPTDLSYISSNIERQTAIYESISRDSYERTQEAAKPLERAVHSLTDVTQHDLPKEYIPDLLYFLLRSCVDGHCQKTLDTVAKRTFNPYCYPYVSGDYLDPKAVDKCFCTPEFENEIYCSGGGINLEGQPETQLQCGEPVPKSSGL